MVELRLCDRTDGLTQLTNAQAALQTYQSQIQAAQTALQPYQDAISASTVPQKKDALENAQKLEICLKADSSVTVGNGWDLNQRVENAYEAVYRMIITIGNQMFSGDSLLGALQFKRTFRGTRLNLVQNVLSSGAFAITGIADKVPDPQNQPDTSTINLYTTTTGARIHEAPNIVHEFGHVLLDQNRGAMYLDWESIRLNFNNNGSIRDAMTITDGWLPPDQRENRFEVSEFPECSTVLGAPCQKLEIERIADMFLYWVYQLDSAYKFDTNSSNTYIKDVAMAFQNYVKTEGAAWTRTIGGSTINLTSQGMRVWLENAASLNVSADCSVN